MDKNLNPIQLTQGVALEVDVVGLGRGHFFGDLNLFDDLGSDGVATVVSAVAVGHFLGASRRLKWGTIFFFFLVLKDFGTFFLCDLTQVVGPLDAHHMLQRIAIRINYPRRISNQVQLPILFNLVRLSSPD